MFSSSWKTVRRLSKPRENKNGGLVFSSLFAYFFCNEKKYGRVEGEAPPNRTQTTKYFIYSIHYAFRNYSYTSCNHRYYLNNSSGNSWSGCWIFGNGALAFFYLSCIFIKYNYYLVTRCDYLEYLRLRNTYTRCEEVLMNKTRKYVKYDLNVCCCLNLTYLWYCARTFWITMTYRWAIFGRVHLRNYGWKRTWKSHQSSYLIIYLIHYRDITKHMSSYSYFCKYFDRIN